MNKNSTDSFEISRKQPFNKKEQETNFFLMEEIPAVNYQKTQSEPIRRLNDYDFNLLKDDAYKDVSDDIFKLEYKISRLEECLKDLEAQIQSARAIHDYDLIDELVLRMIALKQEYDELVDIYNEKNISTKISGSIMNLFGEKFKKNFEFIRSYIDSLSGMLISKMPKRISSILELKKTLSKLENINKSVNDLMTMNMPYGENFNKYDQLSKYIIKANSIQSEISRYIK